MISLIEAIFTTSLHTAKMPNGRLFACRGHLELSWSPASVDRVYNTTQSVTPMTNSSIQSINISKIAIMSTNTKDHLDDIQSAIHNSIQRIEGALDVLHNARDDRNLLEDSKIRNSYSMSLHTTKSWGHEAVRQLYKQLHKIEEARDEVEQGDQEEDGIDVAEEDTGRGADEGGDEDVEPEIRRFSGLRLGDHSEKEMDLLRRQRGEHVEPDVKRVDDDDDDDDDESPFPRVKQAQTVRGRKPRKYAQKGDGAGASDMQRKLRSSKWEG